MALSQQYGTINTVLDILWSAWDCTLLVAERHLWDVSIQLHLSLIPGGKICLDLTEKNNQSRGVAQDLGPEHPMLLTL